VSWYQRRPDVSLALIEAAGIHKDAGVIDVGGGASVLVDFLLDAGYSRLAVLDLAGAALKLARKRLAARANQVEWFEAGVMTFQPPHRFALWHDRAVFHFLTEKADRQKYVQSLERALLPDGHAIIATLALEGPPKCSGLDVMRHDEKSIAAELGASFRLLETRDETHVTPWETEQKFAYFRFQKQ
jgi:ubiquinone/menaquinone biosynthesis C-methylase UbiE